MNNTTHSVKKSEIERKWYILDAANKPLGRVATEAAKILRGKHKPTYTPHMDVGDHVIIINCKDAVLTGNKLHNKIHYWHTGWIGGIKQIRYDRLMDTKPDLAMNYAVKGMLPHNRLGRKMATRLRVYADDVHAHQAQNPEIYNF